jgi:hypothetical protein
MAMSSFEAGILVACAVVLSSAALNPAEPMRRARPPGNRCDGKPSGRNGASPRDEADGRHEALSGPRFFRPAATTGRPSSSIRSASAPGASRGPEASDAVASLVTRMSGASLF